MWNQNIKLTIIESNWQFVHVAVSIGAADKCFITFVYASPNVTIRRAIWRNLFRLASDITVP